MVIGVGARRRGQVTGGFPAIVTGGFPAIRIEHPWLALWKAMKARKAKGGGFRPKVELRIERDRFTIKTAGSREELLAALRLRHEVFYAELLGRRQLGGLDVDGFDFGCDHLIVRENATGRVVGTYRLLSPSLMDGFYSETEFNLGRVRELPGTKLELGRACIHRDYRNGATMSLIWRGITEYLGRIGGQYFLGCSSVKTESVAEAAALSDHLRAAGHCLEDCGVYPLRKFLPRGFLERLGTGSMDAAAAKGLLPPLLQFYLKAGAKVAPVPAYDRKFRCFDFFTLMDCRQIAEAYGRKYMSGQAAEPPSARSRA